MSTQLGVNVAPKESIPMELTTVSITTNITTVSVMTVSSELTALPTGSVATLSKLGTSPVTVPPVVSAASTESVPLTETVESTESMPPEETSELTESVLPEATESTLLEETSESTESVPPEATESTPLEETSESTESVPPEATESTPLEETFESTESVSQEATESSPPEETSESKESVLPEATESTPLEETFESTESVPPEATESMPMEEISELTEAVLPEAITLLSTSVAQGLRGLFAKSTESAPSEVTSESTESAPSGVTNFSAVSAPTTASSENIPTVSSVSAQPQGLTATSENIRPESTTVSSVSAQPQGLTATSKVQSVPPELTSKAREDAIQLHRAFEGWGCDATTIVKILAHRSATQRALIRREYKTKFSEDLDNRLSKELRLSADLKRAVLLWMHDPATRDAVLVRQGLTEKLTLKLDVAIEVICSRTPSQIERLKKVYRPLFGSYLEQDIESHALGDNKKLLLAYVSKSRSEGTEVDATMVDKDANALFKDGEYKLGTNEETFIRIFSERSWAHLAAVNAAYRRMYVNSLRKAVKHETSWNFKCALLIILQCAENPAKYFAKVLHKAMDRFGTDEKTLSRIIVSRAEIDIQQIKAEYLKKYGKSLSDEVHSETSGNYRAFLLSLLDTHN